jgi:hypothetical protein
MRVNNQPSFGSNVVKSSRFDRLFYSTAKIPEQAGMLYFIDKLRLDGKNQKVKIGTQIKFEKQKGSIWPKIKNMVTMSIKDNKAKKSAGWTSGFTVEETNRALLVNMYNAVSESLSRKK